MFSSEVTVLESARRREERLPASLRARYGAGGAPERALCRILDVTKHGARLEVFCDLPRNTSITLTLPFSGIVRARVTWSKDFEAGCKFLEPLKDGELASIFAKGHA
ncbi:MAG: pilus assembly protein PilZ [Rhizorhabdus sp.]|nr:pilus assembly protein PilZ [Rhizorhabdus sp.]